MANKIKLLFFYGKQDPATGIAPGPFYLHWDEELRAPISSIMDPEQARAYLTEYGCYVDNNDGLFDNKVVMMHNQSADGTFMVNNNLAGINHEPVSWEQILELYK